MTARSLVLASCAALALLAAAAPNANAQYYQRYDGGRERHWEHEARERGRWNEERREHEWREHEWRERQPVYVPAPYYYQPGW